MVVLVVSYFTADVSFLSFFSFSQHKIFDSLSLIAAKSHTIECWLCFIIHGSSPKKWEAENRQIWHDFRQLATACFGFETWVQPK